MVEELISSCDGTGVVNQLPHGIHTLGRVVKRGFANFNEGSTKLLILGVPESRGSEHSDFDNGPDAIRSLLYGLSVPDPDIEICDLGNLKRGRTLNDTYAALRVVCEELTQKSVPVLVLGGSQDLTLPLVSGQGLSCRHVLTIDDMIDYSEEEECPKDKRFISSIPPGVELSIMACQSYFMDYKPLEQIFDERAGEVIRLGSIRDDIIECEPILRDASIVSLDYSAMRACDAPGQVTVSPCGLSGEELCQLTWYAGLSPLSNIFGIFGYSPKQDMHKTGAMLCAQAAWYYMKGVANKKDSYPGCDSLEFNHYHVASAEFGHSVLFLQHKISKRWWMECCVGSAERGGAAQQFIACSEKDYRMACKDKMPEKWWRRYGPVDSKD